MYTKFEHSLTLLTNRVCPIREGEGGSLNEPVHTHYFEIAPKDWEPVNLRRISARLFNIKHLTLTVYCYE